MTATATHHENRVEVAPGVWRATRPERASSLLRRWTRERACRGEIGHCWHPDGFAEWFCCSCGGETEGQPAQECVHCLAEQPTAGTVAP